jgi:hypothetical protein
MTEVVVCLLRSDVLRVSDSPGGAAQPEKERPPKRIGIEAWIYGDVPTPGPDVANTKGKEPPGEAQVSRVIRIAMKRKDLVYVRTKFNQIERRRLNDESDSGFRRITAKLTKEWPCQDDISQCIETYDQDRARFSERSTVQTFQVIWCGFIGSFLMNLKKLLTKPQVLALSGRFNLMTS